MSSSRKDLKLLRSILKKYASETASAREKDFVNKYFELLEARSGSGHELSDTEREELEAEIKLELMANTRIDSKGKVYPLNSSIWSRVAVAASLILIFGLIAYIVNKSQFTSTKGSNAEAGQSASNSIQPGNNRATLTLSDGSVIVLDSSNTKKLATQGSSDVIKLSNGTVAYTASDTKESVAVYNTMSTPRGGTFQLLLPDGSRVWLNAASSITYPTSFIGNERKVSIAGEVYFEVARDTKKPFRITLPDQSEIRVVGTMFNTNTYGDNGYIETTLIEGKIMVSKSGSGKMLRPGQQALTPHGDNRSPSSLEEIRVKDNVDLEQITAWKNGYFHFNREDIKTVMYQIGRWYDVDVVYQGTPPKDRFIGELPRSAPFTDVLRALEKIGVPYSIEGKRVIVKSQ